MLTIESTPNQSQRASCFALEAAMTYMSIYPLQLYQGISVSGKTRNIALIPYIYTDERYGKTCSITIPAPQLIRSRKLISSIFLFSFPFELSISCFHSASLPARWCYILPRIYMLLQSQVDHTLSVLPVISAHSSNRSVG